MNAPPPGHYPGGALATSGPQSLAVTNAYLPPGTASRTRPLLMLLALFVFGPVLAGLFGILSQYAEVFGALAAIVGLLEIPMLIVVIIPIVTSLAKLRSLTPAAIAGDTAVALPPAHFALRWVFRNDIRLAAFYLIGLTAESRGDFREAADCFGRALAAMPLGNVAKTRRRIGGLVASHLALSLAACGRAQEAHQALWRSQQFLMIGPGAFDFLDSLNEGFTANDVEPGRDPRSVAALAGVATAYANGAHKDALDIITREQQALSWGILPRERALVLALERKTRAAIEGAGAMRSGSVDLQATNPDEAWAARYLSAT